MNLTRRRLNGLLAHMSLDGRFRRVVPRRVIVLNDDGGWCWFHSPRALVTDDAIMVGSVATGRLEPDRKGNTEVATLRLRSGRVSTAVLHPNLNADDHAAPALLELPNGNVLAMYATHGREAVIRYRLLEHGEWTEEREIPTPEKVSYTNLVWTPDPSTGAARIYNFHRGRSWNPDSVFSDDLGATWHLGDPLIVYPDRPYVHYAADRGERIHFITSEGHPGTCDNGLHYGVLDGDAVVSPAGTLPLSDGPIAPESLWTVFKGDAQHVAWGCDLAIGPDAIPVAVWSVQVGDAGRGAGTAGQDLRYHYGRWDGARWNTHEIAFAGSRLYAGEDDYTGLAIVDPDFPSTVYISTNSEPTSGNPLISSRDGLRHWEIFRGSTPDAGKSWRWKAITWDSTMDNLRPVVPRRVSGRTALLWLRGTYRTYRDYDLEVVATRI